MPNLRRVTRRQRELLEFVLIGGGVAARSTLEERYGRRLLLECVGGQLLLERMASLDGRRRQCFVLSEAARSVLRV